MKGSRQVLRCGVDNLAVSLPAAFKADSLFVLGPPSPGVPGEVPDRHAYQEIGVLGPVPARIRGDVYVYIYTHIFLFGPKHSWALYVDR